MAYFFLLLFLLLVVGGSGQNLRSTMSPALADPTPEPTPTPACQHNLCHKCTPDKDDNGRPIAGPGSCCDSTDSCYWDRVFKEFICLPDYPWICAAPNEDGHEPEFVVKKDTKLGLVKELEDSKILEILEDVKNDKGSSCWGTYEQCFEMCPPEYCVEHNELHVPLWCCDW
ncbi:hypothetical protein TrST_g4122 [Triparma strigata]|uniref:Uncharacterized protein n=1 Tax=Triparma strigata TaxID=1606541 RepID=A0A9W6ZNE9_9STRA|nr:hypothetical protein TrST_g4122 [Triparma strigata]